MCTYFKILSVILSLSICYTTIMAFCMDLRVIFTPGPDPGSNPGPLECKSEALPTDLFGTLGIDSF